MKIYDPIHGFIHFYPGEEELIDSLPFQRLRHIRQLGVIYLVYPGATHTRFEHSLGVLKLATQIFKSLFDPENIKEVFSRCSKLSALDKELLQSIIEMSSSEKERLLRILRLAALCHDMGHLPLSHTAEHVVLGYYGHEKMTLKLLYSEDLKGIWDKLSSELGKDICKEVALLAIGEGAWSTFYEDGGYSNIQRILSDIITNDYFGADRIDCLLRDASSTGVTHGIFDYEQLIDSLRLMPFKGNLQIGVLRSGVSSIESLLVSRYFMYSRVYRHPIAAAYSYHFEEVFCSEYKNSNYLEDLNMYMRWSDPNVHVKVQELAQSGSENAKYHALAILNRNLRYRALWLNKEDFEGIDYREFVDLIADFKRLDMKVVSKFSESFINGKEDFALPSSLISLQWGEIQIFRSKFSYPNLSVSSSYLYVEPSALPKVKALLNKRLSIYPKFY